MNQILREETFSLFYADSVSVEPLRMEGATNQVDLPLFLEIPEDTRSERIPLEVQKTFSKALRLSFKFD